MAEPIEMPFELWTRVGQRNNVLDGGPDLHGKVQFLGKMTHPGIPDDTLP